MKKGTEWAAVTLIGSIKSHARLSLAHNLIEAVYNYQGGDVIPDDDLEIVHSILEDARSRCMESIRLAEEVLARCDTEEKDG